MFSTMTLDAIDVELAAHRDGFLAFAEASAERIAQLVSQIRACRLIDLGTGAGRVDADALVGHYVDGTADCLAEALETNLGLDSSDFPATRAKALAHSRDLVDAASEVTGEGDLHGLVALALWQEEGR